MLNVVPLILCPIPIKYRNRKKTHPYLIFFLLKQLKEASAVLQKTTHQVQKLVQIVTKSPASAALLRSPTQLSVPSSEETLMIIHHISSWHLPRLALMFGSSPSRCSKLGTGSVCVSGPIPRNDPAKPKDKRRWAQSWDEHFGKETYQDLAQRHPRCHQPNWFVLWVSLYLHVNSNSVVIFTY